MDIREALAINLRKCRQAQRLSQEELAYRAEIDRTYISSIERRVYAASIDVVDRLARELGVEAADLLRKPMRVAKAPGGASPAKGEELPVGADKLTKNQVEKKRTVTSSKGRVGTATKSRKRKIGAP